mmetsp:Transcript_39690/g.98316  ORF Transcript_39690/g.98316 Transcript_39690/m.98316 type:complete len:405 (+) Transcript_39690:132-1346(+)
MRYGPLAASRGEWMATRSFTRSQWRYRLCVNRSARPCGVTGDVSGSFGTLASVTEAIDPQTRILVGHDSFVEIWAAQHDALRRVIRAMREKDQAEVCHAWSEFVVEKAVGLHMDSISLVCASTLDAAMFAAGANRLSEPYAMDGVNCALYALGEYIGFTAARDGLQRGAVNTREHCFAAETILKGLSGDNEHTSTVGVGGSELPLWQYMLPDLGFTRVEECAPGDIVVYTLVSELTARRIAFMQDPAVAATSPQPDEVACHFGVVHSVRANRILVVSKAATDNAYPVYLHALHCLDPSFKVSSCIQHESRWVEVRVHFFRPGEHSTSAAWKQPSTDFLSNIASKYELLMEALYSVSCEIDVKKLGQAVCDPSLLASRRGVRGTFVKFATGDSNYSSHPFQAGES